MGTAAAVFETTTTAIVTAIENGAGQWRMPWSTVGVEFPTNPTTTKPETRTRFFRTEIPPCPQFPK